jgi:hypothetical protein
MQRVTIGHWFRRVGVLGFLFFFTKGMLWLIVPALMVRGCT